MKSEKLAVWYPADPAFRRIFERALTEGFRRCAKHGDLSEVQRLLKLIPDPKRRLSFAQHLKTRLPICIKQGGSVGVDKERAKAFDWSVLDSAKIWPRRLHLSNEAFTVGAERLTIGELIDDFIDAILLSRHSVPEKELLRLKETIDNVLDRRRHASSGSAASSSMRVVK